MGNCKDCKYWVEKNYGNGRVYRECDAADSFMQMEKIGDYDFGLYAEASDDTGLMVGLKTGPLFGCVQFQLKNK